MSVSQALYFGKMPLQQFEAFLIRKNVYAIVNIKPVTQGHVLVISRRVVPRLHDLTEIETLDFWKTVQEVSKVIGGIYNKDVELAVQDGEGAGQTVKHVHCHIMPKMEQIQPVDNEERQPRSEQEMTEEANQYKLYFDQQNV